MNTAHPLRLDDVLSSMLDGVITVSEDAVLLSINPAAEKLLSLPPVQDILGKSLFAVLDDEKIHSVVERVLLERKVLEEELSVPFAGSQKHIHVYVSPLHNALGESLGALIVLHDMSAIKRVEFMRKDFVANVSHELRTPITSIKGFIETLRDGALENPEDAKRFLGIIAKHTDRLTSIIDELLSLSQLEQEDGTPLKKSKENVCDIIASAAQLCSEKAVKKNIRVDVFCDTELVQNMNGHLIEQAVVNLVHNAITYSQADTKVEVRVHANESELEISVSDQGPGIAEEHLSRVFERFYRVDKSRSREAGGTGLGLALVKHIAAVHGGRAVVESTLGVGSTFRLKLPRT